MSERYLADENSLPGLSIFYERTAMMSSLYAAETLVAVSDEAIMHEAVTQTRIVLTFDRDFGELVFRHR